MGMLIYRRRLAAKAAEAEAQKAEQPAKKPAPKRKKAE